MSFQNFNISQSRISKNLKREKTFINANGQEINNPISPDNIQPDMGGSTGAESTQPEKDGEDKKEN